MTQEPVLQRESNTLAEETIWSGGSSHWRRLAARYWKEPEEALAAELVQADRIQSWIFFCECVYQKAWIAGARGMKALGESKAIPHLKRGLYDASLLPDALDAILDALTTLRAYDLLCAAAVESSLPVSLRIQILHALSHAPHPQVTQLFLRLLDSPQQRCQDIAIQMLGQWQIQDAIPALAKRLREGSSIPRLQALIHALAQMDHDDALDAIREHLLSSPPPRKILIARWLLHTPRPAFAHLFQLALLSFPPQAPEIAAMHEIIQAHQAYFQQRAQQAALRLRHFWEEELFTPASSPSTLSSHLEAPPSPRPPSPRVWREMPPSPAEIDDCLLTLQPTSPTEPEIPTVFASPHHPK